MRNLRNCTSVNMQILPRQSSVSKQILFTLRPRRKRLLLILRHKPPNVLKKATPTLKSVALMLLKRLHKTKRWGSLPIWVSVSERWQALAVLSAEWSAA